MGLCSPSGSRDRRWLLSTAVRLPGQAPPLAAEAGPREPAASHPGLTSPAHRAHCWANAKGGRSPLASGRAWSRGSSSGAHLQFPKQKMVHMEGSLYKGPRTRAESQTKFRPVRSVGSGARRPGFRGQPHPCRPCGVALLGQAPVTRPASLPRPSQCQGSPQLWTRRDK